MNLLPTLTFRYWGARSCWEALVGFGLLRDRDTTAVLLKTAPDEEVLMADSAVPSEGVQSATQLFLDTTRIYFGLGFHKIVVNTPRLTVTLGARGIAQYSTTERKKRQQGESDAGTVISALALLGEFPLQAEFFLSDHSSIVAMVALTASVASSFQATSNQDSGLAELLGTTATGRGGVALQLGGRYSGGLGFTYYF